ncbi:hypothetical protein QBC32DRAFT_148945 [Pseudoneurospora amorphoporcata]|uniref:Uncharacterized protein n=1 Tax=Pseudoneurospora amorphoporcata TaxID=241081 RepID=A0AAN6SK51_9PEZI|nr:hypothetical protein QBC32DRAFT_148945 [Pseudoneurospora amorphoporcata]
MKAVQGYFALAGLCLIFYQNAFLLLGGVRAFKAIAPLYHRVRPVMCCATLTAHVLGRLEPRALCPHISHVTVMCSLTCPRTVWPVGLSPI